MATKRGSAHGYARSDRVSEQIRRELADLLRFHLKDLRIALTSAESLGIELPGAALAKRLYEELESGGGSELGTQAIWLLYADASEREASGVRASVARSTGRAAR